MLLANLCEDDVLPQVRWLGQILKNKSKTARFQLGYIAMYFSEIKASQKYSNNLFHLVLFFTLEQYFLTFGNVIRTLYFTKMVSTRPIK